MLPVAAPMAWDAGAEISGISLSWGVSAEELSRAEPVRFERVCETIARSIVGSAFCWT